MRILVESARVLALAATGLCAAACGGGASLPVRLDPSLASYAGPGSLDEDPMRAIAMRFVVPRAHASGGRLLAAPLLRLGGLALGYRLELGHRRAHVRATFYSCFGPEEREILGGELAVSTLDWTDPDGVVVSFDLELAHGDELRHSRGLLRLSTHRDVEVDVAP